MTRCHDLSQEKRPEYAKRAYFTVAGISSYDIRRHRWSQKKQTGKMTRLSVESSALATSNRAGELRVESGFVGPYQFDSAHTFRY